MSKRKGRPKGSRNVTTVVDVEPVRCPKCGNTGRTVLNTRVVIGFTLRRCCCTHCGQSRIEREKN